MQPFERILQGGDRRSIGNSNQVVAQVLRQPARFAELIHCLWSPEPVVRMRAADAAEKVSLTQPHLLAPFQPELFALAAQTKQPELRWHLALMIPRLRLSAGQRDAIADVFRTYLDDRSSLVKTCALQALFDLSRGSPDAETEVGALLERVCRTGTPAMKARARNLLKQLGGR
jgi:hypothetical protein